MHNAQGLRQGLQHASHTSSRLCKCQPMSCCCGLQLATRSASLFSRSAEICCTCPMQQAAVRDARRSAGIWDDWTMRSS